MNSGLQPKRDVLPAAQNALWPQLAPTQALGYVLYGGTAIALRLGHRTSLDFDFFTDLPLNQTRLREALPFLASANTLQESAESLTVLTQPPLTEVVGVKVSFFGSIDFGRVGNPECTTDGVLQVAALEDLMATKLKVILQRVEAKDYRDIAAMLASGASLPHGLAAARKMFGNTFQPSESLKALTWFRGGDLDILHADERNVLIAAASRVRDLPDVDLVLTSLSLPRR